MNRELREVQEIIRSLRIQEESMRSSREQLQEIEARMRLSLSKNQSEVNLEDVSRTMAAAELDRISAKFNARIDYHTIGTSSIRKLGLCRQDDDSDK